MGFPWPEIDRAYSRRRDGGQGMVWICRIKGDREVDCANSRNKEREFMIGILREPAGSAWMTRSGGQAKHHIHERQRSTHFSALCRKYPGIQSLNSTISPSHLSFPLPFSCTVSFKLNPLIPFNTPNPLPPPAVLRFLIGL